MNTMSTKQPFKEPVTILPIMELEQMRETFVHVKSSKKAASKTQGDGKSSNSTYLVSIADLVDICQRHAMNCPRIDIALIEAD